MTKQFSDCQFTQFKYENQFEPFVYKSLSPLSHNEIFPFKFL